MEKIEEKFEKCRTDIAFERDNYGTFLEKGFYSKMVVPYINDLPFLNNEKYYELLYRLGTHLYTLKTQNEHISNDGSFERWYNLLVLCKLLIDGTLPLVKVLPNTIPVDFKFQLKKGMLQVSSEDYRDIMLKGLKQKIIDNKMNRIRLSDKEATECIAKHINLEWIKTERLCIESIYPELKQALRDKMLVTNYACAFPKYLSITSKNLDLLIRNGLGANKEMHFILFDKGRPVNDALNYWVSYLDNILNDDSNQTNNKIRYNFIYDYLEFFNLYNPKVGKMSTSTKADLIKVILSRNSKNLNNEK